jgi:hypothetical protein
VKSVSVRKRSSAGSDASRSSAAKASTKAPIGAPHESAMVAVRESGWRSHASETPCTAAARSGSSTIQRSSAKDWPSTI